ncbi:MAG: aldehyde dehydrogenase family protein [Acidimicrobiia bacterium]|nr:aldehyde dehydrogenase family protein [Acidimicrobiia bacterium]
MELNSLQPGMAIPYGGNRVAHVPESLAQAFSAGDRLVVVQDTGDLLHIRRSDWEPAQRAVTRAHEAFQRMGSVTDAQITNFYLAFADRLADDKTFKSIADANESDVRRAKGRGRSTTRLVLSPTMRTDMITGLRGWAEAEAGRGSVVDTVTHTGWRVELVKSGLGVVGFVFEGRPNVFADATGVIRSGNTVVFRIGSDALETAQAIVAAALDPALESAGLPPGTAALVDSPERAAGWAMFSDPRLALAVARGSGPAVAQLGAVARQAGIPVSLHGTGGAWIIAAPDATPDDVQKVVVRSLDRKVCNTLNTMCIPASRADDLIPSFLSALDAAGRQRSAVSKLHVVAEQRDHIPASWFEPSAISRAEGIVIEPRTEEIGWDELGREWEWEDSPEVTLVVVDSIDHAVTLFHEHSPRFAASLVGGSAGDHTHFFDTIDAPFVGNGFTRWVDGQYALNTPELGLSNWQFGRLFGRGGVLSGDSVFTIRTRAVQDVLDIGR